MPATQDSSGDSGEKSGSRQNGRSRSPGGGKNPLPKGHTVQFFLEVEAADKKALLVRPKGWTGNSPLLLQSHGWLEGTLQEPFDPAGFDVDSESTWPLVRPNADIVFETRGNRKVAGTPRRVQKIREPTRRLPLLSVVLVLWGGKYSAWMDEQESNDGDWGTYG